ncbi:hypothetical protein BCR22_03495 [Enterococcus plantarum]|uniref:hypothetical protein n=1 Tax=Enterococcus plantarum TaxID=1077675 RepID=UPI00084D00CE|nr:hypothetical protein [Enterococcus plantarum]OEG13319.1 hypothetical protein BCR22_03495 [Enterococcus plantarum]
MFKNSELLFNNVDTVNKLKDKLKEYHKEEIEGKEEQLLNILIKAMEKRISVRYFSIMKQWNDKKDPNKEQWGFILMSVNCILIELYFQIVNGFVYSDDCGNSVCDAYRKAIPDLISNTSAEDGEQFYYDIRCSLIHQAQTNRRVAISFEISKEILPNNIEGEQYFLYNPSLIFISIEEKYKNVFKKAMNTEEHTLRNNILKKIEYILYKKV